MSDIECPECGKDNFTDKSYMRRHHKLVHGETLREKSVCSSENCNNKTFNEKFCSEECMGDFRRKYEYNECNRKGCSKETYKFGYCSRECANNETWKERDNPAKRDEVKEKLSRMRKGSKNPFYGQKHTDEALKKISESTSGENHHLYGVTGEDHPSYGVASGLKLQKVEETGHRVRSNWEKKIDLLLYRAEIDYEYEPDTFNLPNGDTYTPDFIVNNSIIIEVKGWPDERSVKRAELFMEEYPEFLYLVVGNELPCDIFLDWENYKNIVERIESSEYELK